MNPDELKSRLKAGSALVRTMLEELESMGMGLEFAGVDEDGDPVLVVAMYESARLQ